MHRIIKVLLTHLMAGKSEDTGAGPGSGAEVGLARAAARAGRGASLGS